MDFLCRNRIFFILIAFVSITQTRDVYADSIKSVREKEKPFRMNKLNILWDKAKKNIFGPKIADLYADLTVHDQKERQLKKLKTENGDKDGLKEAEVQQHLLNIIDRYGLNNPYEDRSIEENEIPRHHEEMKINDKRLKKIWNEAKLGSFDDDELAKLKEEFWHQQMKIDEFEILKNEIYNFAPDNELDKHAAKEKHSKNRFLKEKFRDMRDGYDKLNDVATKASNDMDNFTDHRVYELWALAKKANFTEEELMWFKDELKHFESRLSKHDYFKEQLKQTEDVYKTQYKEGNYPQKYAQLEDKVKGYEKKVKKIHADLEKRINKAYAKHTEL